jgi:hypothetical protein
MMVKDYNDSTEISEDRRFLSNVDASAISLSDNDLLRWNHHWIELLLPFYVLWKIKAINNNYQLLILMK